MPIPEHHFGLPEAKFDGLERFTMVWEHRAGCDWLYGTISWKSQRYWFTFSDYDQDEELIRYSVYSLTDEQARILDDWYLMHSMLYQQWRLLANTPATAGGLAQKQKEVQLQAFKATLPRFESSPIVAFFTVSDYGQFEQPKKEG